MNRIINQIETATLRMNAKIESGEFTTEQIAELSKKSDMSVEEYVIFQEKKSLAVAMGKLTSDEGMTVYGYLGNTPDTFNSQPFPVKAVLTRLFAELLTV